MDTIYLACFFILQFYAKIHNKLLLFLRQIYDIRVTPYTEGYLGVDGRPFFHGGKLKMQ